MDGPKGQCLPYSTLFQGNNVFFPWFLPELLLIPSPVYKFPGLASKERSYQTGIS